MERHGGGRHHDGGEATDKRGRDGRGESGKHSFLFGGDFWHGADAGAGHAGVAFVRRRENGGLPPVAGEWGLFEFCGGTSADGCSVAAGASVAACGNWDGAAEFGPAVYACAELEHVSATALFCVSALFAGNRPAGAGDVCAVVGEFGEPVG